MSPEDKGALEYGGVYVDERMIAEMAGSWPAVRIPRSDIISIELMRGSESKRPIIQFLVGVVLVAMGLFPCWVIVRGLVAGNLVFSHEILLLVWLFLGGWMIYEAVKKRTLLRIQTPQGTRKIAFHGQVDPEEVREFVRLVETDFGYPVWSQG